MFLLFLLLECEERTFCKSQYNLVDFLIKVETSCMKHYWLHFVQASVIWKIEPFGSLRIKWLPIILKYVSSFELGMDRIHSSYQRRMRPMSHRRFLFLFSLFCFLNLKTEQKTKIFPLFCLLYVSVQSNGIIYFCLVVY
jgi:hypothetical protein